MKASSSSGCIREEAYAVALASVRSIGPKRVRELLVGSCPSAAWEMVTSGQLDADDPRCRREAESVDVDSLYRSYAEAGVIASFIGSRSYPATLEAAKHAPGVIFSTGDISLLNKFPKVAIVGTRSATRYGLGVASQFAAELAAAGVCVVSGLAEGVDTAAHEGSCGGWENSNRSGAPPCAVAAGGLDQRSCGGDERIRRRITRGGVVVSGDPIGVPAARWSFPKRCKLMAMLVDAVVVVESHLQGGSMRTVDAAAQLGKPVGAVPGSIRSPASAGTNSLLADGCFPVRDLSDILVALSLDGLWPPARPLTPPTSPMDIGESKDSGSDEVLDALGWEPCSLEELVVHLDKPVSVVCSSLERLSGEGRVRGGEGYWERIR
ncbi:MAG: DNA-protecting protein DprA [Actinobacteria bacterium]|nr:DNA-protecting protein DprA [Actinomycetota bacterium]